MKLDIMGLRRRISAIVESRDDRLLVLLRSESPRWREPALQKWMRQLARDYEDDIEVLACVSPGLARHGGRRPEDRRAPALDELAGVLATAGVGIVVVTDGLGARASPGGHVAWTVHWNFGFSLVGDVRSARKTFPASASYAGTVTGGNACVMRPGIVVPPGYARRLAAVPALHGDAQPYALVVDLTCRPGWTQHGHALARYMGEAIRDDVTHATGVLLDATAPGTQPYGDDGRQSGIVDDWSAQNVDVVEATLDVLANAVRERRMTLATRPRGSLWRRL